MVPRPRRSEPLLTELARLPRSGGFSILVFEAEVLNIVKKFLVSKKGDEFERDIKESEDASEEDTGSDIMHQVFLLRQLIIFFRNQATKLIFIDGTESSSKILLELMNLT